jgi:uncharacterized protein YcnI
VRPSHVTGGKLLLGMAIALLAALSVAAPAGAHITVHPETLPAGSGDIEVTFRVPNERDNANTVALQVFFPTDRPFLAIDVLPVPGWTARVSTEDLSKPIQSSDGPVSQVVEDVIWTATNGGIAPGQYLDFSISAGGAPTRPGRLIFKSLQTYSSGEVVRWIQVPSTQNPDPDNPAPILTVTNPSAQPVRAEVVSNQSTTGETLAIVALVVAALGCIGVIVLLMRCRGGSVARPD